MIGITSKNLFIFCIILMLFAPVFARPGPAEDRKKQIDQEDDLEASASGYYGGGYPGNYYYGGFYPYGRIYSYGYPGYYGGYGGYGFGGYYPYSYYGFY